LLFLEEVVTGQRTDLEAIRQRARLFGWDLSGVRAVVVAKCDNELVDSAAAAAATDAFGKEALGWARGHEVIAIAAQDSLDKAGGYQTAETFRRKLERDGGGRVVAAIGSPASDPLQLAQSHSSARDALRIAEVTGRDVVRQRSVAVERLLLSVPPGELQRFVNETIGPLAEHDQREGSQLCQSLEAYVTHANGADAARALFVHYNTLKHRLARIVEILGCDLHDPNQRVMLATALRAQRLLHGDPRRPRRV
jgi:PucR family transcriptional regulator, purine catabolism regulatory protein